jgi:hypothetical protein
VATQRVASVDGTEFDADAISHLSLRRPWLRPNKAPALEIKLGADQRGWIDVISQELANLPL